jgi:Protein of unknown function (DUF2971)
MGVSSTSEGAKRLFHYTNAAGLLGIVRDAALWATDPRFLNDEQETMYARGLFHSTLAAMDNPALAPDHPPHSSPAEFGQAFDEYRARLGRELESPYLSVYVTCFCESGDLLSQWRGYGSDHGYAIEFEASALEPSSEGVQGFRAELVQVNYGPEGAGDAVSAVMRGVHRDSNLGHLGTHAYFMAERVAAMLAAVKHPGFSEEKEWRLVMARGDPFGPATRFRTSSMAIIPYIEMPFPREAVVSVRVGPGQHMPLRQQGVERLLRERGWGAKVLPSTVPLRT